jgi:tetratricopeptide (TPR) repeat protein
MSRGEGDRLAYVFLDEVHLGRWRGHCLARLGAAEAVDDLTSALARLDPTFTRAQSALLVDLALAYSRRGDRDAAREYSQRALGLAEATSSARQRKRIQRLLAAADGRAVA